MEDACPMCTSTVKTAHLYLGSPRKGRVCDHLWHYTLAEAAPVPEGVQGKEPQTPPNFPLWERACDCCRIDGAPVLTDSGKWIHCYDDDQANEPCVAGSVFALGEAAGRRSAITEFEREKLALQMLREMAEAKPDMKLVNAAGVILGSLRPPTAEDIARGQEIAKKLGLQEKTK